MSITVSQIHENEYAEFYKNYLVNLEDQNLIEYLETSLHEFIRFVREVPMDKIEYVYAAGKWTLKDIIQHVIDSERIFCYRALRIARNDLTPLPGFDENFYAQQLDTKKRSMSSLLSELACVRESTISLFKNFTEGDFVKMGIASNFPISVGALGFIIIGHQKHHKRIFKERYL